MTDYTPPDTFKQLQSVHYDSQSAVMVEPIKQLPFTTSAANPGAAKTVWLNTATGHLMRGAVDLEDPQGLASYQVPVPAHTLADAQGPYGPGAHALTYAVEKFENIVHVSFLDGCDYVPSGLTNPITITPALPVFARPTITKRAPLLTKDEGVEDIGSVYVTTGGNITVRPTPSSISVFTAPSGVGNSGFPPCGFSFSIE